MISATITDETTGAGAATAVAHGVAPMPTLYRSIGSGSDVGRDRLKRLAAVVLLDGTVRRSPFAEAIDRSLLELPVADDLCLRDLWRDHVARLAEALEVERVPCRIVVGRTTRPPSLRWEDRDAGISIESDPGDLRGTGGVLRDLAEQYDDPDATLLVATAAQLLVEPLHELAREAAERGGDVTVVANDDGSPASVALLSCRALMHLPKIGFVDLKEQGLPQIAARCDVTILRRSPACGIAIRTPADYLAAARAHHRISAGDSPHDQPFGERWARRFGLVERGAEVDEEATLHDSVVLRGARVEGGAMVANSIVCGGALVRRNEKVQREILACESRGGIEQAAQTP